MTSVESVREQGRHEVSEVGRGLRYRLRRRRRHRPVLSHQDRHRPGQDQAIIEKPPE